MVRKRETGVYRIMVMSAFAFIFLAFVGQIAADWQNGLFKLCDFAITSFIFLLPVLLFYFIGKRQIVSIRSGGIFGIFWGVLCFCITLIYSSGDFTASIFIGAESFSILSFGRWIPPSSFTQSGGDDS